MKVSSPKLNSTCVLSLNRSSSQHWRDLFLSISLRLSQHSWTFVTLCVRMCSPPACSTPLTMHLAGSTITTKSSRRLVYARPDSHPPASICLSTIITTSRSLGHQTDFLHQSQSQSISQLSRNHGTNPIIIKCLAKCSPPTPKTTN